MARIRTIKPEFWTDEKLSQLSPIDRLVFIGLISMADDFGRVHDNVKIIDAYVFPNTDDSVRESLANLSRMLRIRRGKSSNGTPIIEIANWAKHQRVDKPQPHLSLPPIDTTANENTAQNTIPESVANNSGGVPESFRPISIDHDLGSRIMDHGSGSGIVDQCGATVVANHSRTVRSRKSFQPPTLEEAKEFASEHAITIDVELFWNHYQAQGWRLSNGRAMSDWQAAIRKWASNDKSHPRDPSTKTKKGKLEDLLSKVKT